jgi:hypothetical protein
MALRSLVAKMRNPVSAALRLPPPALSAGARAKLYSSAKVHPFRSMDHE